MSQNFYTNVKVVGDNVLYRGIKNGKRIQKKIEYKPVLFVPSKSETLYKTIYGEYLSKIEFESISQAKGFVKKYEGVENFKIFGNTKFEYCAISDIFPDEVYFDIEKLRIAIFDIEVNSDPESGGFAPTNDPFQPIISISLKFLGEKKSYLFGYHDFNPPEDVHYIKCRDEYTLCKKFIDVWSIEYPDIVSGWNVNFFDIPYIINRFNKIISESETRKLSPWNKIRETKIRVFNGKTKRYEEETTYSIIGVSTLDYIELYKKYQKDGKSKESYKLDFIANDELKEGKVEYEGSLHKLYTTDTNTFYLYNIQDTLLVEKLDNKLKLFSLGLNLAYNSKTNPEDIFEQTKMWDSIVYNHLKKKNIQVPKNEVNVKIPYEGAFVKETIPGMHKWVVSLDATSLYPSIIMGKNISPETLVEVKDYNDDLRSILSQGVSVDNLLNKKVNLDLLKKNNVTLTPNGQFFRTDKKGFMVEIVEELFAKRDGYKKYKLKYESEYEDLMKNIEENGTGTELEKQKNELKFLVVKNDNLQNAIKLCLNSLYGCMGSIYFRFFDVRIAEGITLEGQLSNKWVFNRLNDYFNTLLNANKDYVVAGDTDSLIFTLHDLVNKLVKKGTPDEKVVEFLIKVAKTKIQPKVDEFCADLFLYMNSYNSKINYKLEKICSNSIFVAKKRYALYVYSNEGVVYNKPKIKVTGLEIVKSSTPKIVRKALKDCVELMLSEKIDDMQQYVADFKKTFFKSPIEDISFPRGVKGIGKYHDSVMGYTKGTPIHVRASIVYNNALVERKLDGVYETIKDGDKIKYCYLKVPNHIKENVIAFTDKFPSELDINQYIDYNEMWNKAFMEPLNGILNIIGWSAEKEFKLDDFMI